MFSIDLLIYITFTLIMCQFAIDSHSEKKGINIYILCYILFFTFICAIRYNVGGDFFSYAKMFDLGIISEERKNEYIWNFFVFIVSKLDFHYSVSMGIVAFVQIYFLVKALKDYRMILVFVPIVLFGGRYFIDMMSAMRQMIVACAFVWATKYIFYKKYVYYIIFIYIASKIHNSAYFLLPLILFPSNLKLADKRIVLLVIFITCFILGLSPSFSNLIGFIEQISNISGYDEYSKRAIGLIQNNTGDEHLSFGPMMMSYFLISLILIYYGPRLQKKYEFKIPMFNLWYNFSYIYSCLYFLVCNISNIFIRPVQNFEFFQMIILALLLYDLNFEGKLIIKDKYKYILLILIIWVNLARDIYKNDDRYSNRTIYKVFFLNKKVEY